MARIVLQGVRKTFAGDIVAVDGLSLRIESGELFVLVGPSGCGKTTTLRLIAGLELPDTGTIEIGGRRVNDLPAHRRNVALVVQPPVLYPHWNVYRNLAAGVLLGRPGPLSRLAARWFGGRTTEGVSADELDRRVREAAGWLGLDDLLHRRTWELSAGQRQRVVLGRAVVRRPAVLLFDEPLANLDAPLRVEMRTQLRALHQRLGTTCVLVTHDQAEALSLGQRLGVMDQGRVLQVAPPDKVYQWPADRRVARFFGSPPMNVLAGRLESDRSGYRFVAAHWSVPVDSTLPEAVKPYVGREVLLGIRPEHVALSELSQPGAIGARVLAVESLGDAIVVQLHVGRPGAGDMLWCKIGMPSRVEFADQAAAVLAWDRARWFDPATGAALVGT